MVTAATRAEIRHLAFARRPRSLSGDARNKGTEREGKMAVAAEAPGLQERTYFGTSKYGWGVVAFSGAGWFFDGYVINVWPLAIPFVMTDLQLTVQDIGTIT